MIKIHNLAILVFICAFFKTYGQDGKITEVITPDGVKHYEQLYKYPGGKEGLYNDIGQNFKLPKKAQQDKLQGKIILEITIDTLGVGNGKIIQGIRDDVDNAAIEMVKKLKRFDPAKMDDKKFPFVVRIPLKI